MQSKQLLAAAAAAAKKAIQQQQLQQQQVQAPKVSVPVDAFKAFCVYEDENRMPDRGIPDGCDVSLDSSLNISAIR